MSSADDKTLAHIRQNRNQVTGTLLSDVEARENLEDGVLDRLLHAREKTHSFNQSISEALHKLCFQCGWGITTGYTLESLRNESEQEFVDRELVQLFAKASAGAVAVSGNEKPTATISKIKQQQQQHQSENVSSNNNSASAASVNLEKITIPDLSPYADLLATLRKERVPEDVQPRVRKTVDVQFLKPFFPEEFKTEPALQNLSRLLMNVSNIIIMADNENDSTANDKSSILQQQQQAVALRKRRSGLQGSNVGGKLNPHTWKYKQSEIERKIRKLQGFEVPVGGNSFEDDSVNEDGNDNEDGKDKNVDLLEKSMPSLGNRSTRGIRSAVGGSASFGAGGASLASVSGTSLRGGGRRQNHLLRGIRESKHSSRGNSPQSSLMRKTTVGNNTIDSAAPAKSPSDPQVMMQIEKLQEEELEVCENWFDATTKIAADFVTVTQQSESSEKSNSPSVSGMAGGGMVLSSGQLIRTKDEIAEATQALLRLREDRAGGLQDLKYDQEKLAEMMEEKEEEDLEARVEYKKFCEKSKKELDENIAAQAQGWQRIIKEMENISRLSASATAIVKQQVDTAEREMERSQRFAEVQAARDAQVTHIEKLHSNFKSAMRLIDATCEYLGMGQAKITTAKVGAELSQGLREAAANLHEAYFEYASRLCRRIHNCEKRMAASALVQRNVDETLVDLKSAKVIADEAASLMRGLATTRDALLEQLDLATDKLVRHLGLHKSIRDSESANHSSERPVQQRIKDLEVMLREDVIRTLAGHVSQESIFLDVARSRLEVATKMSGGDDEDDDDQEEDIEQTILQEQKQRRRMERGDDNDDEHDDGDD